MSLSLSLYIYIERERETNISYGSLAVDAEAAVLDVMQCNVM